jgi:hypothetical protein
MTDVTFRAGRARAENYAVMQLRALFIGLNEADARVLRTAFTILSIRTEYVPFEAAPERIQKGRFEAIAIMHDGTTLASEMVQRIRSGVSNRDAVILLVSTPLSEATAFHVRANFFLALPVTEESVISTLKAAYGLLVRSRSRWHREAVNSTAYLNLGLVKNVPASIINLSQGGMLLKCSQVLRQQQMILVRFGLPGTDQLLCLSGQVVWTRSDGTSGVRFSDVPALTQKVLQTWVEERLELAKVYANFREKTGVVGSNAIAK